MRLTPERIAMESNMQKLLREQGILDVLGVYQISYRMRGTRTDARLHIDAEAMIPSRSHRLSTVALRSRGFSPHPYRDISLTYLNCDGSNGEYFKSQADAYIYARYGDAEQTFISSAVLVDLGGLLDRGPAPDGFNLNRGNGQTVAIWKLTTLYAADLILAEYPSL